MSDFGTLESRVRRKSLLSKVVKAEDCIKCLENGVRVASYCEDALREMEPDNEWGKYETFVTFLKATLQACKDYPDAKVVQSHKSQ